MHRLAGVMATLVLVAAPAAAAKGTLSVKVTYAGQPADAFDLVCVTHPGSTTSRTCDVANRHHVATLRAAPGRYVVTEERDTGTDRCYARHGHCTVVRIRAGRHERLHWNRDTQTAKGG